MSAAIKYLIGYWRHNSKHFLFFYKNNAAFAPDHIFGKKDTMEPEKN